jgi:hypothetical protein
MLMLLRAEIAYRRRDLQLSALLLAAVLLGLLLWLRLAAPGEQTAIQAQGVVFIGAMLALLPLEVRQKRGDTLARRIRFTAPLPVSARAVVDANLLFFGLLQVGVVLYGVLALLLVRVHGVPIPLAGGAAAWLALSASIPVSVHIHLLGNRPVLLWAVFFGYLMLLFGIIGRFWLGEAEDQLAAYELFSELPALLAVLALVLLLSLLIRWLMLRRRDLSTTPHFPGQGGGRR